MRRTLRRSCAACARSKHSCDLRTPRCSRCIKRKAQYNYANQPWTTPTVSNRELPRLSNTIGSFNPFDSYPQTRLPREHIQRLIHSCMYFAYSPPNICYHQSNKLESRLPNSKIKSSVHQKIAFQYYPLDLSSTSNPFLVSWWPLALGDPALFHISLQTACLDDELLAQKGFQASEILMADSVVLLRHKVENVSSAIQDGTMNSVITLAAIEVSVNIFLPLGLTQIAIPATRMYSGPGFWSEY
jgi:hypothetical protein